MSFKDISYLELWQPLFWLSRTFLCNFGRVHHEEQFCEIVLNLDQRFRKKCHFKTFLIESCMAEWNHLCNFGRRHHEEQFCEIILKLTSDSGGNTV